MSAVIYTISHPLTDDVVYVGCTSNLEQRIKSYIQNRQPKLDTHLYIEHLRKCFLYPKIEVLDVVKDGENPYELETFWIRMMRSWGFNLLNKNKVFPPYRYIKTKYSYKEKPSYSGSCRKWSKDLFFVGNKFELGNTTKRTFTATFKNYCRKFDVKLFLKYSEDDLIAEVVEVKPLKGKAIYIKKGYPSSENRKTNKRSTKHLYEPWRTDIKASNTTTL